MKHRLFQFLIVFSGVCVASNAIAQETKTAAPVATGTFIVPKLTKAPKFKEKDLSGYLLVYLKINLNLLILLSAPMVILLRM